MAITISHSPELYQRVYHPNINYFVFNTDKHTETNCRLYIKIYKRNLTADTYTFVSDLKIVPDRSGDVYFNPSSILKNYLTGNVDIAETFYECTNSTEQYKVQVYEQYGDPIATQLSGVTGVFITYNGCDIYEGYDWMEGDNSYWLMSGATRKGHFLVPTETYYLSDQDYMFLYYLYDTDDKPKRVKFTIWTDYGTKYYFNYLPTYDYTYNNMAAFGCGPMNILSGGTLPTGWTYYTIDLYNTTGSTDSVAEMNETPVYVYRKDKCDKWDYTQVFWLNEHGGWSNYTFTKRQYLTTTISRKVYDRFLDYGYTNRTTFDPQRGLTQHSTKIDEKLQLNTDWLNDYERLLIQSLLYSTDVRVLFTRGPEVKLIPYVIIDEEFVEKTQKKDKLYSYSIEMKKATQKIIQNG